MTDLNDCPACETGGKCPTGERKSVRHCPACKWKLNPHAPKICPQCGVDLMRLLWEENDRLNAPAPTDQLALAIANAEHWRQRAESYESVIDNLRTQRDWAQQVESLTDTALRERIRRLATAAEHFWRDRDSWMQQAEDRTEDGSLICRWNAKLLLEARSLREKIEQLKDELTDSRLHQRGMVESVELQEAERKIEQLTTLAVAVGKCDPDLVPASVYKAWQRPDDYRQDELVRLRDREAELDTQVARLTRQLDAADKTIVKNWSIDEENARLRRKLAEADATIARLFALDAENARLRAQRDEAAAANEHLQGWGTVIQTDPGKWLILVSSEPTIEAAVAQIENEIIGAIEHAPCKRVAVCPASHFDGIEPLDWEATIKEPKGTP